MALINCIECNNQVSDMAKSCPQCGVPIKPASFESISSLSKVASSNAISMFSLKFWFSSQGRLSRSQYLTGFVVLFLIYACANLGTSYIADSIIKGCYYRSCFESVISNMMLVKVLWAFIFLYSHAVLAIKRFHDFNKSGYQVLTLAIPIVGFYFLWVLVSTKGDDGSNKYDENSNAIEKS